MAIAQVDRSCGGAAIVVRCPEATETDGKLVGKLPAIVVIAGILWPFFGEPASLKWRRLVFGDSK